MYKINVAFIVFIIVILLDCRLVKACGNEYLYADIFIGYSDIFFKNTDANSENSDKYHELIDEFSKEDYANVDKILNDNGVSYSFKELIADLTVGKENGSKFDVTGYITNVIISNRKAFIQVFLLAIFSSVFSVVMPDKGKKQLSDTANMVISISIITILTAVFIGASNTASKCFTACIDMYRALCPIFFPAVTYSSGSMTCGAYYEIVIMMIYVVDLFINNILFKANHVYMMVGILDSLNAKENFSKMCDFIKKGIRFCGKAILTVFLGLNGIKSIIAPVSDSVKMNYFYKAVSMIPGIGNSATYVSKSIIGTAAMVKNSIGVAAIIVIITIVALPFIKLVCLVVLYQALAAFLQPVADKRIIKAISVLSDSIGNLIYLISVVVVLLCITIAIICVATNVNYFS